MEINYVLNIIGGLIVCNIINRELWYHWSLALVFKQIIIAMEGTKSFHRVPSVVLIIASWEIH
jgi:hypothetical protein